MRIEIKNAAVLGIILILAGCGGERTPKISAGIDGCSVCNMTIEEVNQACGYFSEGQFVTFDSPGCLIIQLNAMKKYKKGLPDRIFFADYLSSRLLPADSTTFLLTDHIPTVMNAGVLCFSDRAAAQGMRKYADETITDWNGFWTQFGEPDSIVEVSIADESMQPGVIVVSKGDLIQWRADGSALSQDVTIRLQGYDEIGEVHIPAHGAPVSFRMFATKPGSGFPFVRIDNGQVLGMVKVAGAHTAEEEEM